jgi:3-phosphoshikimate 1-carboxyvinyltransferase
VLRPVLADMADMPDAAMTLAVVACFAEGTSILKGVGTLRVKECDRIEAMRVELGKLGVRVESPVSGDDGAMTVTPPAGGIDCGPGAAEVAFDTYDDHRIAMALSLLSLRRPNVVINNPACVAKTYPGYWREFARLF